MRSLLSASLVAAAALLLGATHPSAPPPPPGTFPDATKTAATNPQGHPDLLERIKQSPDIVRGHVGAAHTNLQNGYGVHVDSWLKGQGVADIVVDFGHQRAITPQNEAELLFLAPALVPDGGASQEGVYRALTIPAERFSVPDALTGKLDQAVRDAVSGAPEDKVLAELVQLSPAIAEPAAAQLALVAAHDANALGSADAAVKSGDSTPEARAKLLQLLGSRLPIETLARLADGKQPLALRTGALAALGRVAANEPARRKDALPILASATQDSDVHVKLAAGLGLANAGDARGLEPLNGVLAGADQDLRADAVQGLARLAELGNPDAWDRLKQLTADPNGEVKSRATNALSQVGPRPTTPRPPWLPFGVGSAVVVVILVAVASRRRKKA